MPNTSEYGWPVPTVGGSGGTWGTELNDFFDDHIEPKIKSVEDTANAALPKAGGALSGEIEIKTERYAFVDKGGLSGGVSFDLNAANVQAGEVTGDITSISFSNWPSSGKAEFVTLELTDGGAHDISWPSSIKWDGASEPSLQGTGVDVIILYSRDGGTTIRGMHSGAFAS